MRVKEQRAQGLIIKQKNGKKKMMAEGKKILFDMCHIDASHLTLKRFGFCFNKMPSQVNLIPTLRDKADNFTPIIKEMAFSCACASSS